MEVKMKTKKEKENKVFISQFAFEELRRLFEKQKADLRYYRDAIKYYKNVLKQYQEQAQTIIF